MSSDYEGKGECLESTDLSFKTGDIIKIQHLDSGAFLSINEKKLAKFIQTKNCRTLQGDDSY